MLQDDLLDDVDFVVNQYSDRRKELHFEFLLYGRGICYLWALSYLN